MNNFTPQIIEQYQLILEKDPSSKVFAPVVEYYRKKGWINEALELCREGVQLNPQFSSGFLVLAQCYIDQENFEQAVVHLQKSIQLSPDNISSHLLLGQTWLNLHEPKKALKSFKMVLFLNPNHKLAQKVVKKLESLTADEFSKSTFESFDINMLTSLPERQEENSSQNESVSPTSENLTDDQNLPLLDRYLSLADAFISRNDFEKAQNTLLKAKQTLGPLPIFDKRLKLMNKESPHFSRAEYIEPIVAPPTKQQKKIEVLKKLLNKLES